MALHKVPTHEAHEYGIEDVFDALDFDTVSLNRTAPVFCTFCGDFFTTDEDGECPVCGTRTQGTGIHVIAVEEADED